MNAENKVLEYIPIAEGSYASVLMSQVGGGTYEAMKVPKELTHTDICNNPCILIDEHSKTLLPQITSHPNWSRYHDTTVVPIRVILERLLERVSGEQKLRIQIVNKSSNDSLVYMNRSLQVFSMEGLQVTLERIEDDRVIEWGVIGIIPDVENAVIYFDR